MLYVTHVYKYESGISTAADLAFQPFSNGGESRLALAVKVALIAPAAGTVAALKGARAIRRYETCFGVWD